MEMVLRSKIGTPSRAGANLTEASYLRYLTSPILLLVDPPLGSGNELWRLLKKAIKASLSNLGSSANVRLRRRRHSRRNGMKRMTCTWRKRMKML